MVQSGPSPEGHREISVVQSGPSLEWQREILVVQSGPGRSTARPIVDRFCWLYPVNLVLTGVSRGFICHGNGNYPDSLVDIISIIGPWKRRPRSKAGKAGEQARKQVCYPFLEIIQELFERNGGRLPREFLKKVAQRHSANHRFCDKRRYCRHADSPLGVIGKPRLFGNWERKSGVFDL